MRARALGATRCARCAARRRAESGLAWRGQEPQNPARRFSSVHGWLPDDEMTNAEGTSALLGWMKMEAEDSLLVEPTIS